MCCVVSLATFTCGRLWSQWASKYIFGDWRYSCGDRSWCALSLAPPPCALRHIDFALPNVVASSCAAGSCTSLTLPCVQPAAAQTREADRRHHRSRGRGRGRALGGSPLNTVRVCALFAAAAAVPVAARRSGAARRRSKATVAAPQVGGDHQAARVRRPRVSGGSGGAASVASLVPANPLCRRKVLGAMCCFSCLHVRLCAYHVRS